MAAERDFVVLTRPDEPEVMTATVPPFTACIGISVHLRSVLHSRRLSEGDLEGQRWMHRARVRGRA